MMMSEVELLVDAHAQVGEGPIWDAREDVLWWIDVFGKLYRYDPATEENRTVEFDQYVGTVVPRRRGGLMLAIQNGLASFDPASGELEIVHDPEEHLPENRFNDGKCDPAGRFWAGTMRHVEGGARTGTLYCLYPDGRCEGRVSDVGVSNGIVWSSDARTMYFIDSPTRQVDAFDFDNRAGQISNRRTVIEIPEGGGWPDGMAIDEEDKLWVALWGGWKVIRVDPAGGTIIDQVDLPAAQTAACAFGGADLSDLFITTARIGLDEQAIKMQPNAGGLFRVHLGVCGVPSEPYAG